MVRVYFVLPALMLAVALLHMPYGYYQLLRLAVTFCAGFLAIVGWKIHTPIMASTFGFIALLYNPLIPLSFNREVWWWINVATIALFVGGLVVIEWVDRSDARKRAAARARTVL